MADNENQLAEIATLSSEIQRVLDPEIGVPEGLAFCEKCIRFRIQLLKDEIAYFSDYQSRLNSFENRRHKPHAVVPVPSPLRPQGSSEAEGEEPDFATQLMREQQQQIDRNVATLIEQANDLKKSHHRQIERINLKEKDLLYLQDQIKEAKTRSEHYERKIAHMKSFSVLNEVFDIEVGDSCGKINGMLLGLSEESGELNWTHLSTAFGNIAQVFQFFLKVDSPDQRLDSGLPRHRAGPLRPQLPFLRQRNRPPVLPEGADFPGRHGSLIRSTSTRRSGTSCAP